MNSLCSWRRTPIYNPKEALELATAATLATGNREPRVLDTLAVAQAANGDFETAIKTVDAALAQAAKDQKLTEQLRKRRAGYLAKKPYRDSFDSPGTP